MAKLSRAKKLKLDRSCRDAIGPPKTTAWEVSVFEGRDFLLQATKVCQPKHKIVTNWQDAALLSAAYTHAIYLFHRKTSVTLLLVRSKYFIDRALIERDHKEITVWSCLNIGNDTEVSSDQ